MQSESDAFIINGANQFAERKEEDQNRDLLSELLEMNRKQIDIKKQYEELINQIHSVTELSGIREVTVESTAQQQEKSVVSPEPCDREQLIRTLSVDELILACRLKAEEEYKDRQRDFDRIELLPTFPNLANPLDDEMDNYLTEETSLELLMKPYFTYYKERKHHVLLEEAKNKRTMTNYYTVSTKDTRAIVLVTPNTWFQDFLQVYSRARTIGELQYPSYRPMDNIYFKEYHVRTITDEGKKNVLGRVKTYTLDILYHMIRFASLYGTINFIPVESESSYMLPTQYTDVEILVHFSAFMSSEIDYMDFLRKPQTYLRNEKFLFLTRAVERASEKIRLSYSETDLVFFCTRAMDTYALALLQEGENNTKKTMYVPDEIIVILKSFILDNIHMHRRRVLRMREAGVEGNANVIVQHSPIARLLNYDRQARREFEKLYKKINPADPTGVNVQNSALLKELPCIHSLYAQLLSASGALYALTMDELGKPHAASLITRTMKIDEEYADVVQYASSVEAAPGLLFYVMLGLGTEKADLLESTKEYIRGDVYCGMTKRSYFKHRPDRTAFFNSFATYSSYVAKIPEAKNKQNAFTEIRWMSREFIEQIRMIDKKNIQTARASYINMLLKYSLHDNEFSELDVMQYFKSPHKEQPSSSLKADVNVCKNFVFFILPILYNIESSFFTLEDPAMQREPHDMPFRYVMQMEMEAEEKKRESDRDSAYIPTKKLKST